MDLIYSTINFYDKLVRRYREYLKPDIISVVMIQSKDQVYLETTEIEILEDGLEKQTTKRIDLGFITDGEDFESEELFFNPKDPIEKNVRKFINELSPYSIINTTDLFHEEACGKINRKYNTFGVNM
ncbi:hypothetical protein NBE98_08530 [Clostridium swellfunianum]|uniref:hypothetical protein n=1 Tax=Clostridium swellfunianum TaxID=1367462 RepID=UPI00202EBCC6|nr:hypothetical protein [Clostridium swellfunianum]MCM0648418.1 hypothetical protein [Clostridium swellfunianum]